MAKKALLIGGGIVVALVIGGGIAAQPYLERRAAAAADALFDAANRQDGITVTRGDTRFSIWSRSVEIDDVTIRTKGESVPTEAKADRLVVEGVDILGLLLGNATADASGQDVEAAIKTLSLAHARIPALQISTVIPDMEGGTINFNLNNLTVEDLSGGVIGRFYADGGTLKFPETSEEFVIDDITFGRIEYADFNLNAYANAYLAKGAASTEMMPLVSSSSMEPFEMRLRPKDATEDGKGVVFRFGKMTSGAMSMRPSAVAELESASRRIRDSASAGGQPTAEEMAALMSALRSYYVGIAIDSLAIDGLSFSVKADENVEFSSGPIAVRGYADAAVEEITLEALNIASGGNSVAVGRYGLKNADFMGILKHLDKIAEDPSTADNPSQQDIIALLPRGELFVENLAVKGDMGEYTVGHHSVVIDGERGALPSRVAYTIEGLDVPLPEEAGILYSLAEEIEVERLVGDAGVALTYDKEARSLVVERMGVDFARIGAFNVTADAGSVDLEALLATPQPELPFMELLSAARLGNLRIELRDRDGGLDKLIGIAAQLQGMDAAMLKQQGTALINASAPEILGPQVEEVAPALVRFIENPKALTITARAKDDTLAVSDLLENLQRAPETLAEMLDIKAVAE